MHVISNGNYLHANWLSRISVIGQSRVKLPDVPSVDFRLLYRCFKSALLPHNILYLTDAGSPVTSSYNMRICISKVSDNVLF